MSGIYGPDLARVHHLGFGEYARRAAPGVIGALRSARIRNGLIVELGCGSGILARELSLAGYDVLGMDASSAMLRLARRVAPRAALVRGSNARAPIPRARAVISIGEALTYSASGRRPALAATFRRVANALGPGGLFIFDLIERGGGAPMAYRAWRAGAGWTMVSEVRENRRLGIVVREIVTFVRSGGAYRRRAERHTVGVYSRGEVRRWLRGAGLIGQASGRYGRVPLPPRRIAFFARKPS